jgi:two-component system chemotaxis response regulator CheB
MPGSWASRELGTAVASTLAARFGLHTKTRMDRIVVVGASAGGVSALTRLAPMLRADFPAALLAVVHCPPGTRSMTPGITGAGPLRVETARDGKPLLPQRLYLAIADYHLMVNEQQVLVRRGPRENGFRPSIDVLFRAAAYWWGARAIAVILSGALDDGVSGLHAIKSLGGVSIVQDPRDAAYGAMPMHALRRAPVDHVATAQDIGRLLEDLVRRPAPPEPADAPAQRERLRPDIEVASGASSWRLGVMELPPSRYTCPECRGVLFEIREGNGRRFRCHTGHGYSDVSLLPHLLGKSEDNLWDAVRSVQEAIMLMEDTAAMLERTGEAEAAREMREKIDEGKRQLEALRNVSLSAENKTQAQG